MNSLKAIHLKGWTLSETLIMMIVAGVIFLAVMDGISLFMRYTQSKTKQITDNSRFYEGYYRLQHITAWADSIVLDNGRVKVFREEAQFAELLETDSLLINRMGSFADTLMWGISGLGVLHTPANSVTDSLLVAITDRLAERLTLYFPVKRPTHKNIIKSLREKETPYVYEEL